MTEETKICVTCGEEKTLNEFPYRNKEKGIRRGVCNGCKADKIRMHYEKNKQYYVEKAKVNKAAGIERNKKIILNFLKGKSCEHCGANSAKLILYPVDKSVLNKTVAVLAKYPVSEKRLLSAISLSEILCQKCLAKKSRQNR